MQCILTIVCTQEQGLLPGMAAREGTWAPLRRARGCFTRRVMALERTLSIVKPDAVEKNCTGAIVGRLEEEGFRIVAMRRMHLTRGQAEGFYAEHKARGFFGELVAFMSRGPIVVMALERENAVAKYREVIGATDPAKAADGTIRKKFGANVGENAVHGSDAPETAIREIGYFFAGFETV